MSEQDQRARPTTCTPPRPSGCRCGSKLDPFRADDDSPREKRYALTMFPYPSGDLHMGHAEVTALHDVIARYWWQRGYEVLNPIGWDSFGLPAENAAIQRNEHPATYTYANIETQAASFKKYAVSFDWSRRLHTSDPEYYRWTQWLFLKLRERGLAYRKSSPVNWCPNDQTVLANEQVVDGFCERCGAEVTKRELTQWYFKVTDYAQRLLDDMDELDWPERVLTLQRNWIGRSEGAHVDFEVTTEATGATHTIPVYTTRPDTLFGTTFMVVAADAKLAGEIVSDEQRAAYEDYLDGDPQVLRHRPDGDRPAQDRRVPGRATPSTRSTASRCRCGPPTTCWPTTAPARSWPCPGRTSATGTSRRPTTCRSSGRCSRPRAGRGEAFTGSGPAINSANETRLAGRAADRRGQAHDHRLPGGAGERPRRGQLPAARLAAVPAAVLGLPDPGHPLPGRRRGRRTGGPAARRTAGAEGRRPEAQGRLAAGGRRGLGQRRVPEVRRAGQARLRHDGHLRRLELVLPALLLAARRHPGLRRRQGARVDAGRAVRRRRRARGAAPDVQPLLHQGPARHGHGRLQRAVHRAAEPGRGDQPGQEDEQVAGQRRQPGGPAGGLRGRRRPADAGLRRTARGQHRLGRHVAGRLAAVPAARVAPVR